MQMFFGFMVSDSLSAAAKLGVADLLKGGPKGADELARESGVHARSLYRLLRALASVGVFSQDTGGRFRLTPLGGPLRSDDPDSLRSFMIFMGTDWHHRTWADLPYSIQTGRPAFERLYGKPYFDYLAEHPEPAQVFHDAMTSLSASSGRAVAEAYDFSGVGRLVDVGGGHGLLLASVLAKYPEMRGVLLDAPQVIEGAKGLIEGGGLAGRVEAVAGDFFESVPAGGDAYIMKHIIHDWDDERAATILGNCREAMAEGGRLLVVEMVIPEGDAPSPGKFLDLEMLLFMRSFERTEAEYRELFGSAGFELTRVVPTPSPYGVIEGVRR
jgi:hypothetical protein